MSLPFVADGYGLDRAIAAMWCHAKHGETVSFQAARAALLVVLGVALWAVPLIFWRLIVRI